LGDMPRHYSANNASNWDRIASKTSQAVCARIEEISEWNLVSL